MGLVVGHRAGRPERHDGPVVGPQARTLDRLEHTLLDARLPHLGAAGRLAPRPGQRVARDPREDLRRLAVARQLRRRPARRKPGHERRGRHQPRAERFEQLDHAVRDAIQVRDLVPRRRLDGERAAADQRLEVTVELAPRAVGPHFAGKIGECLELDAMRDRDRTARARQQDEQAPRSHPGVPEDAAGDRVDLTEVVQQPAVGPEAAECLRERREVEAVQQRHQSCRGSVGAARHSHTAPPVARQETWSMAPSKPTRSRSSSVNPAPYSAHAAPSGVACTASASPTRATGTWLSRRSSPANTARAARRAAAYPRALGPARAASRVSRKRRRTARRAARRPASANTRSASGRRPTSRSSASTCDWSAGASRRTMLSYSRSCIATVAERPSRLESSSSANSDKPSSTGVSRFLTASRTASGTMLWTTARETYHPIAELGSPDEPYGTPMATPTPSPPPPPVPVDEKRESFERE